MPHKNDVESQSHKSQAQLYPVVELFDADELKNNYLFGITGQIKDPVTDCPPADDFYDFHLRNAIGYIEQRLNIKLTPTDIIDEQHDYDVLEYRNFGWIQLNQWPVLEVKSISSFFPTSVKIFDYPLDWVRGKFQHGIIQLVPQAGSINTIIIGQGGQFLPLVHSRLTSLPNFWHVDYVAGFAPGKVPPDVKDAVMKRAAIAILNIAGELVGGLGVTNFSLNIDGLGQSTGLNKSGGNIFSFRIKQYQEELEDSIKQLSGYWKGMKMSVI